MKLKKLSLLPQCQLIESEYPELDRTHKDHGNPTPGPAWDDPKNDPVEARRLQLQAAEIPVGARPRVHSRALGN